MDQENRRKYQLECKLKFWYLELETLLALPKQKFNEMYGEGLEALDLRKQPGEAEFQI